MLVSVIKGMDVGVYCAPEINGSEWRIVSLEVFGFACYQDSGRRDAHGYAIYLHQGVVGTTSDAEDWLLGDDEVALLKIFNGRGYRDAV